MRRSDGFKSFFGLWHLRFLSLALMMALAGFSQQSLGAEAVCSRSNPDPDRCDAYRSSSSHGRACEQRGSSLWICQLHSTHTNQNFTNEQGVLSPQATRLGITLPPRTRFNNGAAANRALSRHALLRGRDQDPVSPGSSVTLGRVRAVLNGDPQQNHSSPTPAVPGSGAAAIGSGAAPAPGAPATPTTDAAPPTTGSAAGTGTANTDPCITPIVAPMAGNQLGLAQTACQAARERLCSRWDHDIQQEFGASSVGSCDPNLSDWNTHQTGFQNNFHCGIQILRALIVDSVRDYYNQVRQEISHMGPLGIAERIISYTAGSPELMVGRAVVQSSLGRFWGLAEGAYGSGVINVTRGLINDHGAGLVQYMEQQLYRLSDLVERLTHDMTSGLADGSTVGRHLEWFACLSPQGKRNETCRFMGRIAFHMLNTLIMNHVMPPAEIDERAVEAAEREFASPQLASQAEHRGGRLGSAAPHPTAPAPATTLATAEREAGQAEAHAAEAGAGGREAIPPPPSEHPHTNAPHVPTTRLSAAETTKLTQLESTLGSVEGTLSELPAAVRSALPGMAEHNAAELLDTINRARRELNGAQLREFLEKLVRSDHRGVCEIP